MSLLLHLPLAKWTLICWMIVLRTMIGFHPHSGQDNHHNNNDGVAYGGDFEAQRHWMELTINLPLSQWYIYDLQYWGLDYPPLTAYISWICGKASQFMVGPDSVALVTSRGLEDVTHKAFMRFTVLFLDVLVYFPAVIIISKRITSRGNKQDLIWIQYWSLILALIQPSILLIDHGHFQYNTVALGLALLSFHYMTRLNNFVCDGILSSIFFCLALNFKQMTLYYAPAVFAYLLGRCFSTSNQIQPSQVVTRIAILGSTVISVFIILWLPFYLNPPTNDEFGIDGSGFSYWKQILSRLFPFQRGLFESKVSNLWCALSTRPISIRRRIPVKYQPLIATTVTLLLILPPSISLFHVGKQADKAHACSQQHMRAILWGCTSTSLAFFLASFQVHEKSILMAVAPLSLLILDNASFESMGKLTLTTPHFAFVSFFSILATWSMWPLMQLDQLQLAYWTTNTLFLVLLWAFHQLEWNSTIQDSSAQEQQQKQKLNVEADRMRVPYSSTQSSSTNKRPTNSLNQWFENFTTKFVIPLGALAMMGLHFLQGFIFVPPPNLPDLYPVLWSIVGCALYCFSWLYCVFQCDGLCHLDQQAISTIGKMSFKPKSE